MKVYLDIVIVLNFTVDFLLLMATNRLTGFPQRWSRLFMAAGLGGLYGGICMLPQIYFLGNVLWRVVFLLLMGLIAFGCHLGSVRRCALFLVLCMALGGMVSGLNAGGFWGIILSGMMLYFFCLVGFNGERGAQKYVQVQLQHKGKSMELIALRDTGNLLCDPITGQDVLILSVEVTEELLGLHREQLLAPVETLASANIKGLRLLPYRTVGSSTDFLLAIRLDWVKVGNRQGSCLAALSPERLDRENTYQALTGGNV